MTGQVDFIECDSPVELVMALLSKTKHGMPLDKLGSVSLRGDGAGGTGKGSGRDREVDGVI